MDSYKPPALDEDTEFHAFISHSNNSDQDLKIVEKIREKFKKHSLKSCNVLDDFIPGLSVDVNINNCIRKSNKIIFVVSKKFMKSTYMKYEIGIAIYKEGSARKVTIIPILVDAVIDDLPVDIRRNNVLMWGTGDKPMEESFWDRLMKEMCSDNPSSLVVAGDFFHGLAWSYFYGFLKLILPGLKGRTEKFREENKLQDEKFLDKLLIILPNSGFCPGSLTEDDQNVVFNGHISFKASRAGNVDRDFKSSVYKVTHPETQEEYFIIAEFATPLMSMFEMEQGNIAGLSADQKLAQKKLFDVKLAEILENENNKACSKTYVFLRFNDPRKKQESKKEDGTTKTLLVPDGWRLSQYMADTAKKELEFEGEKEKTRELLTKEKAKLF